MVSPPSPQVFDAAKAEKHSVRAGMVKDPKDYRWSSYAAAVAGDLDARRGVARVLELSDQGYVHDGVSEVYSGNADIVHYAWRTLAGRYRVFIYEEGQAEDDLHIAEVVGEIGELLVIG